MITFRLTLVVVLLAYAGYAKSCSDCRPAIQIAMCPDFHCYRCGPNEVSDCIMGRNLMSTLWDASASLDFIVLMGSAGFAPMGTTTMLWRNGASASTPAGSTRFSSTERASACPDCRSSRILARGAPSTRPTIPNMTPADAPQGSSTSPECARRQIAQPTRSSMKQLRLAPAPLDL